MKKPSDKNINVHLAKAPTGIQGLDEITYGGLPEGRTTLIAGSAGSGKTLLSMEFLVRGAREFNENGVFMAFEESDKELISNVSSLGFKLDELVRENRILLDHVHVDPKEIEETGEYDLEGLFIRLDYAIKQVNAKRVVLDTIESLFSGFSNPLILRAELRRLFTWLKNRGVTAIITGERGDSTITRQGLEEYVSDCVIVLDHRVKDESSTRRLRIVKYRGSLHGTNEYPFLIDESGFSVMPITSLGLNHAATEEHVSSGVPELDTMLDKKGFYRGSSILVSGTAGTGKSSLSATFTEAACKRGEKVVYFSLEESPAQIIRNMQSIGVHLEKYIERGQLIFHSMRPTMTGLEMHLTIMHKIISRHNPSAVVVDPLNSFLSGTNTMEAKALAMRLIDFLKMKNITGFFTYLSSMGNDIEHNFISSLIDTWILLRDIESSGERNRGIYILKSRGMNHSNQIREFILSDKGIKLIDVYAGMDSVLTGSSRIAQEARNKEEMLSLQQQIDQRKRTLNQKRKVLKAKIEALKAEFEAEEEEEMKVLNLEKQKMTRIGSDQEKMAKIRKGSSETTKI
jgi:circadian clock protein KaiC